MAEEKKTLDKKKISISDLKNSKDEKRIMLSTGFRNIDTTLGYRVYDEHTNELIRTNRGILSGSKVTLTGVSHSGKSTLAIEMAGSMIRPWVLKGDTRAKIYVFDTEVGVNRERFKILTKYTLDQINDHVEFEEELTVEAIKKCILGIVKEKDNKEYKLDQMENHSGRQVLMHAPSIIIIDSITNLITDKVADIQKDTSNTMYMQVAGEIDRFMRQYGYVLHRYNISIITVAHTGKEFDIDAMPGQRPKRKWKFLPAGHKIKAPSAMTYGCDVGIHFDSIVARDRSQMEEKQSAGYLDATSAVSAIIYKSRQTGEGASFYLVQDPAGFDPLKSLIFECQKLKILQSKPGARELAGYGSVKNNDILNTFKTDPTFRQSLFLEYDKYHEEKLESNRMPMEEIEMSNTIYDLLTEDF